MSTVLFVGAGFSAAFGQPTMNHFMHYALDKLGDADRQFLLNLVLDARRANSILESSPTNLEDLLSFAIMGDRLQLYGADDKPRAPRLRVILRHIYSHVPRDSIGDYWERYRVFKSFLGFDNSGQFRDLQIITTNYDLNIESAMTYNSVPTEMPFTYKEVSVKGGGWKDNLYVRRESRHKTGGGVPLFKLHGSVNLFELENGDIEGVGALVTTHGGTKLPYACTSDFSIDGTPLIIPPTFLTR